MWPVLAAAWPGVRRRRTERGASGHGLPVACGVQSLSGGDEALATDTAEFNVFSEISPRASLRCPSSVNSKAFLAEVPEHELERLKRCAPLLSRDDCGSCKCSPSGDLDGDAPACFIQSKQAAGARSVRGGHAARALPGRSSQRYVFRAFGIRRVPVRVVEFGIFEKCSFRLRYRNLQIWGPGGLYTLSLSTVLYTPGQLLP